MLQLSRCIPLFLVLVLFISGCNPQGDEDDKKAENAKISTIGTEPPKQSKDRLKRGNRILGLSVTETTKYKIDVAFEKASLTGIEYVPLTMPFDEIKKKKKFYDNKFIHLANLFYADKIVSVGFELNPIDTNNLRVPAHLQGKKFSDPAFVKEYQGVLLWCLSQMPPVDLQCIVVGNEIDAYLKTEEDWADYSKFFVQVKTMMNKIRPDLPVGTKIMLRTLLSDNNGPALNLVKKCDVAMVTYYPVNSDFTVMDPSSIDDTFARVSKLIPNKAIYFLELGYPTSEKLGSSNHKQEEFIKSTFRAWDRDQDSIRLINFVMMNDLPTSRTSALEKYYKISDPNFANFLSSLGLCNEAGEDKPGYLTLKKEANLRGWK